MKILIALYLLMASTFVFAESADEEGVEETSTSSQAAPEDSGASNANQTIYPEEAKEGFTPHGKPPPIPPLKRVRE